MALSFPEGRAFVIAEAGTNHAAPNYNDRLSRALSYVAAAAQAKADAVKFQILLFPFDLFCPFPGDEARQPRWVDSVLDLADWRQIKQAAEGRGLVFLASVFQNSGVEMLKTLDVAAVKVASRAAATFPYQRLDGPFLISTGMIDFQVKHSWRPTNSFLMHCESKYPSSAVWDDIYDGFSDHSGTPWRAIDAIARDCSIVEVHFHVDERDAGPDFRASLDTDGLRLVCEARDAFAALRKN